MDTLNGAMRLFGKFLDRLGYAAPKISASLEAKGGQVVKPPEGFIVKGTEGPLPFPNPCRLLAVLGHPDHET